MVNRQLQLRERPTDAVTSEHFQLVESPIPEAGPGEGLLRTHWLSFDPAQRGRLHDGRSYVPPGQIGATMEGDGIAEGGVAHVDGLGGGQLVHADVGGQDYVVVARATARRFEPVPADVDEPHHMLGLLGMTGLTAYFGMIDVGRPVEGDAVLVTSAAGATGSIAGQIARIKGAAQVIGTAGSDDKRAWVRDVAGFDDCVDHYADDVLRQIRACNRDGYQVIFDNVGGTLLDAALFNIAVGARVVLCGSISTGYKPQRAEVGITYYQLLTMRSSRMEGFLVTNYANRFDEARRDLLQWSKEGRLVQQYDVLDGLESAPEALGRLFKGGNLGKQLVKL